MRLWIINRQLRIWYEVLSYDRATHTAVLVNMRGERWTDRHFHPHAAKRCGYILTDQAPDFNVGEHHAVQPQLQA